MKILLVDDEKQLIKALSVILKQNNYSVDLAYDGEEGLNPSRNFAFLRRSKDATILVVVNFDEYPTTIGVRIPEHAFEFLSLPEGTQCATDLLTDEVQVINLEIDGFTKVTMPSWGAAVLKF